MIGIYKIVNKINNKVYIGESLDIERRWDEHKEDLNNNKHHSKKLQSAWNKYGEESFEFLIEKDLTNDTYINNFLLELVLLKYEDIYINKYNSVDEGYNCEYTYQKVKNGERELNRIKINDKDKLNKYITIVENRFERGNGEYIIGKRQKQNVLKENVTYEEYNEYMIEEFIKKYKSIKPFEGILPLEHLFLKSELHVIPWSIFIYLQQTNVINREYKVLIYQNYIKNITSNNFSSSKETLGFTYEGYLKMCEAIINNYKEINFFQKIGERKTKNRNKLYIYKENINNNKFLEFAKLYQYSNCVEIKERNNIVFFRMDGITNDIIKDSDNDLWVEMYLLNSKNNKFDSFFIKICDENSDYFFNKFMEGKRIELWGKVILDKFILEAKGGKFSY